MEPKIGEIITIDGIKFITQLASGVNCSECAFQNIYCWNIVCNPLSRKDGKAVIFKKVETNMNEVKIQIPNNCELIKDGDTYIVREKKQEPPRSWEDFCKNYPVTAHEAMICGPSSIILAAYNVGKARRVEEDKNWIVSKEEAEAFLALMQLRQLRKTWVGDWRPIEREIAYGLVSRKDGSIEIGFYELVQRNLLFPTREMAVDFLNCFRDLCETAKPLL